MEPQTFTTAQKAWQFMLSVDRIVTPCSSLNKHEGYADIRPTQIEPGIRQKIAAQTLREIAGRALGNWSVPELRRASGAFHQGLRNRRIAQLWLSGNLIYK